MFPEEGDQLAAGSVHCQVPAQGMARWQWRRGEVLLSTWYDGGQEVAGGGRTTLNDRQEREREEDQVQMGVEQEQEQEQEQVFHIPRICSFLY